MIYGRMIFIFKFSNHPRLTESVGQEIFKLIYSVLKLFTGFETAAFTAWKLMVNNEIIVTSTAAMANSHQ